MNEVAAPASQRIPAFDTAALAAAMCSWIERSDEDLSNLGREARTWARRYDWDSAARAQEAFYLDVAGARRAKSVHAPT
jgi:glycosyltransferase involved in cell wall biosynthesis